MFINFVRRLKLGKRNISVLGQTWRLWEKNFSETMGFYPGQGHDMPINK